MTHNLTVSYLNILMLDFDVLWLSEHTFEGRICETFRTRHLNVSSAYLVPKPNLS